jgi:4-hydroxybenzoate polyprenyltransferase
MLSLPSSSWTAAVREGLYHDPAVVGGVAVALLLGTYGLFGMAVDLPLVVAGFCATTLVYAVDRGWRVPAEDRTNRPARVAWVEGHRGWLGVEAGLLGALGGAMVPALEPRTLVGAGALGGIAMLQVAPGRSGRAGLTGLSKPLVIAATWAVGGGLLPLVEAGRPLGLDAALFGGYRFLFILPNLLLADWADRAGDAAADRAPWTTGWTAGQVRRLATGLLLGAALVAAVWGARTPRPVLLSMDAWGLLLMLAVVWRRSPSHPRNALLADLVVAWPVVPALGAWMIV